MPRTTLEQIQSVRASLLVARLVVLRFAMSLLNGSSIVKFFWSKGAGPDIGNFLKFLIVSQVVYYQTDINSKLRLIYYKIKIFHY